MRAKLEMFVTILITLCSVFVAGVVAFRVLSPAGVARSTPAAWTTEPISNWAELTEYGHRIGSSAAAVTIVEFSDFECPFCRRFAESLKAVNDQYGAKVSHVFIHYPLSNHRFARPAARAAECAAKLGRFEQMHDVLFRKQDSLGLKNWRSYAIEAGVLDLANFDLCTRDTSEVAKIREGLSAGSKVGVRGTPTVIINGLRYSYAPYDSLGQIVSRLLRNP